MEAGEYGLTRGTCFVARRLDVVAVAGLLWISWCGLGGAGIREFFFFVFFLSNFERSRPPASMRPPGLLYLSTSETCCNPVLCFEGVYIKYIKPFVGVPSPSSAADMKWSLRRIFPAPAIDAEHLRYCTVHRLFLFPHRSIAYGINVQSSDKVGLGFM